MALGKERPAPDASAWKPTTVPSQWALQEPSLFEYGGSVWYQKKFDVSPDMMGKDGHVRLRFEGVDYRAYVYLNGKRIGKHEGYFAPFSFDVTDLLKKDEPNVLQLRVDSGKDRGFPFLKGQVKGVFGQHDCRPGGQFAGATVGNTGGIWNHVSLEPSGPARIEQVHVHTDLAPDHARAGLRFEYTLQNDDSVEREVLLRARYGWEPSKGAPEQRPSDEPPGKTLEQTVRLHPGKNVVTLTTEEQEPHLWSTWDRGTPELYRLDSELAAEGKTSHECTTRFGIRSLRFDKDHGTIYVNDEPVFQRGINYLPTEWYSAYPASRFATDFDKMKDLNINAVRVHAQVGPQELYEEADRKGMLVWADFPLIWGTSVLPDFQAKATQQYGEMIDQLYNHPSIFYWAAHNEPFPYNWFLDRALDRTAEAHDPDRPHAPSSPHAEHFYPGWYDFPYGKSMFDINKSKPPLPTEYGAQAVPSSIHEFIPKEDLWPMNEKTWAYHNFQPPNNRTHIGDPSAFGSLADYVETSQKYQYDYLRYVTEYFRRMKYQPTGGLYPFMWKEAWPAVGWGVYDTDDRPKLGAEALREALAPVMLSIEWQKNRFAPGEAVDAKFWVVNDLVEPVKDHELEWTLADPDGQVLQQGKCAVEVEKDAARPFSSVHFEVPRQAAPGARWVLHADLRDREGRVVSRNDYMFGTEKPQDVYRYEPMYPSYPAMPGDLPDVPTTGPVRRVETSPGEELQKNLFEGLRGH